MKNTFNEEVSDHEPADCKNCGGSMFFKLPYGCEGDECEDEDNCYCDCHHNPDGGKMDQNEIERRFKYHAPNDATRELHEQVRERVIEFAAFLNDNLPGESREKSLAFTALEESQFWAHAHLARNL